MEKHNGLYFFIFLNYIKKNELYIVKKCQFCFGGVLTQTGIFIKVFIDQLHGE